MKHVEVRWFAAYREATGVDFESVKTGALTAADLFVELRKRHSRLGSSRSALVAINDEMSDWQTALNEGDRVLFFPPVAGG